MRLQAQGQACKAFLVIRTLLELRVPTRYRSIVNDSENLSDTLVKFRSRVNTLRCYLLYVELLTSLLIFRHFASDVPRGRDTYFEPEAPLVPTTPPSPSLSGGLPPSPVSLSIFFDERFWVYD